MNANEFVKKLQEECEHFDMCSDGCPFYADEHEITCCKLAVATGSVPYVVDTVSQEEQTNDSDVESTLEQVAEESPNIAINAKNVYMSFYNGK